MLIKQGKKITYIYYIYLVEDSQ